MALRLTIMWMNATMLKKPRRWPAITSKNGKTVLEAGP